MIWKQKANELLALTAGDLANVECTIHTVSQRGFNKETHLMWRRDVLRLALAKHGGTFDGVNAIFLKRLSRKRKERETQK
jgi:hypothetical protein